MEENKGFRGRYLLGLGIVGGLAAIILVGILLFTGVKEQRYKSAISTANAHYSSGDYTGAIAGYEAAIQINAKKDTAYLNLATLYIGTGDYEEAKAVLTRGLQAASTDSLQAKMSTLQTLIGTTNGKSGTKLLSAGEIEEAGAGAAVENAIFDRVASYTYTEYYRDFGTPTSSKISGKKVILSYESQGFSAIYYDLDKEKVLDSAGQMPVATAKPNQVQHTSLRSLFSTEGEDFALSKARLTELFGEDIKFFQNSDTGKYYVSAEYKKCRLTMETDADGNVISETAWNALEPLNRSKDEGSEDEADGTASGYVQDAVTGSGMKATLKIRARGRKTGEVISELQSGTDGNYNYAGLAGSYTAEVSAAGYITEYLDFDIIKGQTVTGKNIVLSPELAAGEIRIVLTWGSNPADLDSHAEGTGSNGRSFHIFYGDSEAADIGKLDVDDRNGYGPETITITDTNANFTYSVIDFLEEGTMSSSGATVKVYLPGESGPKEYHVPSGTGVEWVVFQYKDGAISPIGQLR